MLDSIQEPAAPSPVDLLLTRPGPQWPRSALAKLLHFWARLGGKHHYDRYRLEWVAGVPLLVLPSVFNPKLLLTGEFFASQLSSRLVTPECEILDLGTGSGICAVFAAKLAKRVVAVDINPAAVRCATINALLSRVEAKVDVRHGDLFAPVEDEQFDLILFNPPFLRGEPRDDRDRAWRSKDVPERFATALQAHLKPGGCALVLLSSFGGAADFLGELTRSGFQSTLFAKRELLTETVAIFKVQPAQETLRT